MLKDRWQCGKVDPEFEKSGFGRIGRPTIDLIVPPTESQLPSPDSGPTTCKNVLVRQRKQFRKKGSTYLNPHQSELTQYLQKTKRMGMRVTASKS